MRDPASRPWYREPWPWLVMAGPIAVVFAGIATTAIAVRSFDGMVADDYYKQGLGINRTLEREARARSLGIEARFQLNEERDAMRVSIVSTGALPPTLTLKLAHPTLRDDDRTIVLKRIAPDLYEGTLRPLRPAAWKASLEDASQAWRVTTRISPSPVGEGRGEGQ